MDFNFLIKKKKEFVKNSNAVNFIILLKFLAVFSYVLLKLLRLSITSIENI